MRISAIFLESFIERCMELLNSSILRLDTENTQGAPASLTICYVQICVMDSCEYPCQHMSDCLHSDCENFASEKLIYLLCRGHNSRNQF